MFKRLTDVSDLVPVLTAGEFCLRAGMTFKRCRPVFDEAKKELAAHEQLRKKVLELKQPSEES